MLTLDLDSFTIELDEGAVKHVGPANAAASAKLFDVEEATAREFGDKRFKCVFEDGEGNELQVALFPEQLRELGEEIERLTDERSALE